MYNKIFKYTIEKAFINVIKKHKISGSITSLTESPKTVIAYDRKNGLLIASTMRELSDGSFEIFLPYREDGQLTLICRDEGGDYNADIYDRLSLCTVEYAPPEGSNLIFRELKTALLEEYEEAAYTNGFMTIPFISAHENIKGAIAKAITSPLEFKDSGNATITNSDVSDSAEMNGSSFIINYDDSLILRNSKVGATLVHDFFGDGSAKVTIPFNKNNEDLSGNGCSVSNAIRYTSSPSGGFGAKIFTTDITSRRPVNRFNSYDRTKPYTLSFWMLLTSNSPDTTHLVMMEGAFYVKVHNNQSIYFATAASATTWNAETFVSLSTPGLLYTWRHITISFNNGYFKLYLDGVEKTNQTRTNITSTSSTGFLEFTRLEIHNVNISFSMFRIFDKILTQTEVNAIYAERLGNVINSVNTIYGTNFDKKRLALNGTGLIGNAFINLPFDGSIADKSGTGIVSTTTGLEIQDDFIKLDGSVTLHRALTCADTSNGFTHGDENNVEVLCKIQPTSVGSDMVIWKSGNSTNGLGVGIKSGNIGIFANNASVQTSISIPVSNIIIEQWYKLLCKADEIVLLNESGQIVTRQAGSFSSGLALSQESIGGACNGSPLTPGSTGALEYFNGRIYDITTYEKGTSKILTTGQLKLAAEFGSTGIECDIEIEKWDAANNECILWVNIPSLSSTEDNILRLYFQKDHADNSSKITITNAEPETPVGVSQDFIDLKLAAKNDTIASYEEFTAGKTNALTGWNSNQRVKITLDNPTETLYNFPAKIILSKTSGKDGLFDATNIFKKLRKTVNKNVSFVKNTYFNVYNGNQCFSISNSAWRTCAGDAIENSGKKIFRVLKVGSGQAAVGIGENYSITSQVGTSVASTKAIGFVSTGGYNKNNSVVTETSIYPTFAANDYIDIAVDIDNGLVWFAKNGAWVGDPSNGTGGVTIFANQQYKILVSAFTADNGFIISNILDNEIPIGFSRWSDKKVEISANDIAFELNTTGIKLNAEIEKTMFDVVTYPTEFSTNTVKATTYWSITNQYYPWLAFNPSSSQTGTIVGNSWFAADTNHTNQKLNVDMGESIVLSKFEINNLWHTNTSYVNCGIKDFILYGTNDMSAFNNTLFTDTTDLVELGTYQARRHTIMDEKDIQTFYVDTTLSFRYYVFRIFNDWTSQYPADGEAMGVRSIRLFKEDFYLECNVLIPEYKSSGENIVHFYYDINNTDVVNNDSFSFYDSFSDVLLKEWIATRSNSHGTGYGYVRNENGKLKISTNSGTTSMPFALFRKELIGDFSLTFKVDVNNLPLSLSSYGVEISDIVNNHFIGKYAVVEMTGNSNGGPIKAKTYKTASVSGGTQSTSNRIRLTRTLNVLKIEYYNGSVWVVILEDQNYGIHNVYLKLFQKVWGEALNITTSFDNFSINYNSTDESVGYKGDMISSLVYNNKFTNVISFDDAYKVKESTSNAIIYPDNITDIKMYDPIYKDFVNIDGANDKIVLQEQLYSSEWTIEALVRVQNIIDNDALVIYNNNGIYFSDGRFALLKDGVSVVAGSELVTTNEWVYIVATSEGKLYKNAVDFGISSVENMSMPFTAIGLGYQQNRFSNIDIKFVRRSSEIKSQQWVESTYKMFKNQMNVFTISPATVVGEKFVKIKIPKTFIDEFAGVKENLNNFPMQIIVGGKKSFTNFVDTSEFFSDIYTDNDQYTKFLLKSEINKYGERGFVDSSSSGMSILPIGVSAINTAAEKIDESSIKLSNGCYLNVIDDDRVLMFGTNKCTIEFWFLNKSNAYYEHILSKCSDSPYTGWYIGKHTDGRMYFSDNNDSSVYYSTSAIPLEIWTHFAISFDGEFLKMFFNGVNVGTFAKTTIQDSQSSVALRIGALNSTYYMRNSFIDLIKISIGVARYINDFIPVFTFDEINKQYKNLFIRDSFNNNLDVEVTNINYNNAKNEIKINANTSTVKATSMFSINYYPHYAFSDSVSVINGMGGNAWVSANNTVTNQKLNVELTSPSIVTGFILENGHEDGSYVNTGIKNFSLYGTNDISAFNDTVFANTGNLTLLGTYVARVHTNSNISDPQTFTVNNTTQFKYYIFRIFDNYNDAQQYISIRRIKLLADAEKISLFVKVPEISILNDTYLTISYDKDVINPKIGKTGTQQAANVWDNDYKNVYHFRKSFLDSTINKNNIIGNYSADFTGFEYGFSNDMTYGLKTSKTNISFKCLYNYSHENLQTYEIEYSNLNGIGSGSQGLLFGKYVSDANRYGMWVVNSFNTMAMYKESVELFRLGGTNINLDQYDHIIYTNNGASQKIYKNGLLNQSFSSALAISYANGGDMHIIGGAQSSSTYTSKGIFKNFRTSSIIRSEFWQYMTNKSFKNEILTGEIIENKNIGSVPALQTWEYAKKALVTIPAENIPSDMTDFKFPIKLKTSSGTTGYNFNTWFTEMMYSSYIDGNKIKDYKFGSKKHSLAGFNTSNIVYSMDRDLNINGSLKFDGSSNRIVNLKNVRRSYFSGDMSFSVWLKFGPEHLTTTYRSVLGTIGWQELSIYTYNGSIYIVFGDGVSVSYKTTIQIDLKMVIGGWVHLVLALDTKVATKQYYVYVDGVLYSTAGYTYGGGYGANDFLIGSNADYPTNRFIGEIDAFMVFSKTLTQDDVTKLYNGSSLKSYTNRYVTSTFSINENVFHPLKGNPLSNIEIISNKKNQALSASIEFETGKFYIATIVGWRIIASNLESIHGHVGNTNWFYRTSENTWVESGIDKNKAISYACSFPENRMDLDYVKTITQEKFSEIFNQSTGMANIAISMISNSVSAVPEVTKIIYNKKEYWLSKEYDLTDYNGNIVSSDVRWDINTIENIDQNAFLKVFVMITGDTTWTQCTSASPIPGITAGMTTTGKKMKFKVEWDKTINGSLEINKTLLRFKIK